MRFSPLLALTLAPLFTACPDLGTTSPPVDGPADPADPGDDPEPEPVDLTGVTGLRRLSPAEVERTVDDLLAEFGASGDGLPALPLPPPNHKHGFENTIETGNFSTDGLLALLDWADAVGDAATANVDLGCTLTAEFDACAAGYATRLLEAAWRAPVDDDTRALAAQTWTTATADSVPRNGLRALWELALMAPRFWYLSAETDASGRLTPAAMLSQLSYGLWRTMPTADLRARRDALVSDDAVRALAEEMLDDPRAEETVLRFHRDWLNVADGSALDKDPTLYPGFGPELADNFDIEFDAFVMRTLDDDAPIAALFSSHEGFVNRRLEDFYGLAPQAQSDDEFIWRDLGPDRAGILTRPLFLSTTAGRGESALILRGVSVIEHLLCSQLTPPDDAIAEALPIAPDATSGKLAAVADRASKPRCAACHDTIDPLGVAFEAYDAIGAHRTRYPDGIEIPVGGVLESSFIAEPIHYANAVELVEGLAATPEVQRCYAAKWSEWFTGIPPNDDQLDAIGALTAEQSLSMRDILLATITAPWFLTRAEVQQ